MIRLHTADAPNGRKISIALEELGLRYEVRKLSFADNDQLKPEFLKLNPNNKSPVIEDDGLVVWESGAILYYLGEKYDPEGRILPKEPGARIAALQYAFFQAGGIGPNLGRLGQMVREKRTEMIPIFQAEVVRLFGVLDRILADGREYLVGPYSIGDIMHYPWLKLALDLKFPDLLKAERLVAWLERIGARPAVQLGMAVPK